MAKSDLNYSFEVLFLNFTSEMRVQIIQNLVA